MFEHTSRYYEMETITMKIPDGREVRYLRRRLLPVVQPDVVLVEHIVVQGERLDNVTARYLGDPELFWQLCDINLAMRPEELTAEIGRKLAVSLPQI